MFAFCSRWRENIFFKITLAEQKHYFPKFHKKGSSVTTPCSLKGYSQFPPPPTEKLPVMVNINRDKGKGNVVSVLK
jgi:hypothetical protein